MARTRTILLELALICVGAGITILFVSTDGNGQNPVPVAAQMLIVVLGNGVVSFLVARLLDNCVIAIAASAVITDLIFIVLAVRDYSYHSSDPYAGEAALLFPIVFTVDTAPAVFLSSIAFGRMANRFWSRRCARVTSQEPGEGGEAVAPDS